MEPTTRNRADAFSGERTRGLTAREKTISQNDGGQFLNKDEGLAGTIKPSENEVKNLEVTNQNNNSAIIAVEEDIENYHRTKKDSTNEVVKRVTPGRGSADRSSTVSEDGDNYQRNRSTSSSSITSAASISSIASSASDKRTSFLDPLKEEEYSVQGEPYIGNQPSNSKPGMTRQKHILPSQNHEECDNELQSTEATVINITSTTPSNSSIDLKFSSVSPKAVPQNSNTLTNFELVKNTSDDPRMEIMVELSGRSSPQNFRLPTAAKIPTESAHSSQREGVETFDSLLDNNSKGSKEQIIAGESSSSNSEYHEETVKMRKVRMENTQTDFRKKHISATFDTFLDDNPDDTKLAGFVTQESPSMESLHDSKCTEKKCEEKLEELMPTSTESLSVESVTETEKREVKIDCIEKEGGACHDSFASDTTDVARTTITIQAHSAECDTMHSLLTCVDACPAKPDSDATASDTAQTSGKSFGTTTASTTNSNSTDSDSINETQGTTNKNASGSDTTDTISPDVVQCTYCNGSSSTCLILLHSEKHGDTDLHLCPIMCGFWVPINPPNPMSSSDVKVFSNNTEEPTVSDENLSSATQINKLPEIKRIFEKYTKCKLWAVRLPIDLFSSEPCHLRSVPLILKEAEKETYSFYIHFFMINNYLCPAIDFSNIPNDDRNQLLLDKVVIIRIRNSEKSQNNGRPHSPENLFAANSTDSINQTFEVAAECVIDGKVHKTLAIDKGFLLHEWIEGVERSIESNSSYIFVRLASWKDLEKCKESDGQCQINILLLPNEAINIPVVNFESPMKVQDGVLLSSPSNFNDISQCHSNTHMPMHVPNILQCPVSLQQCIPDVSLFKQYCGITVVSINLTFEDISMPGGAKRFEKTCEVPMTTDRTLKYVLKLVVPVEDGQLSAGLAVVKGPDDDKLIWPFAENVILLITDEDSNRSMDEGFCCSKNRNPDINKCLERAESDSNLAIGRRNWISAHDLVKGTVGSTVNVKALIFPKDIELQLCSNPSVF